MLNSITKNALLRRVGLLSLGVAAGQMVTLLASPVLTRIFGPHAFGLFGLFTAYSFLMGNVSSLRYDIGITLAPRRTLAASLWALCLLLNLSVVGLVTLFLILGGAKWLSSIMHAPELTQILFWAPLQIFSIGLFLSASQWANRKKQFKPQALYQFSRASSVVALQLTAGALSLGAMGLAGAQVAGFFLAAAILIIQSLWPDREILRKGFSLRRIKTVARSYRKLPQYTAPQDLMTAMAQNLPNFILGICYGPAVVGLYWLSIRTMQLPINFFSQAIRQVLLQHVSAKHRGKQDIFTLTLKATLALTLFSCLIFLPVVTYGPEIFKYIFGPEWSESGIYARWISIWMMSALIKIPSWCIFHALSLQRTQFFFETATFAVQTTVFLLLAFTADSPVYPIGGLASVCAIFNLVMIATALTLAWSRGRK